MGKVLSAQDMKDVEQMAGVRNSAAHGEFDVLSHERAGLMEQQVNLFLSRLAKVLDPNICRLLYLAVTLCRVAVLRRLAQNLGWLTGTMAPGVPWV
jgi:hypothetical protein